MLITLLLLSPFVLSDELFNRVTNAVHLENDLYLVTTMGGEYHAHLFDAANDIIIQSFVRNGGGPEEARGIKQMAPCNDGSFVFFSKEAKILHYDSELELIREHQTIYMATHSLHCANGIVTTGSMSAFRSEQLETDKEFTIGVSIDLESGEKVADVSLRGSDIYLGPDMRFENLPIVVVYFYIAKTSPENYLITIKGSPVLYLTGGQLSTIKYDDEQLAKTGQTARKSERFGVYGQSDGGVNVSWQYLTNGGETTYRFDFGRWDEEVPFGYLDVQVNNNASELSYTYYDSPLQDDLTDLEGTYSIVRGETTSLFYNEFDRSSNYIYIAENEGW